MFPSSPIYIVVTEMKSIKPNQKGSLTGRLFRLLKVNGGVQESISLQENDVSVGILDNNYYDHQEDVEASLLEAERKQADAIEWQRRKFIC
jgi:hypothetical protein